MTPLVTKAAQYGAKKMLSSETNKYKSKPAMGPYDPYYENIENPKKPGKMKKVKKQIPDYIPSHDADILARARKSAYRLDYSLFNFMGLRFGWSSVIGIVPAVGDVIDLVLSALLIGRMSKVTGGFPTALWALMLINWIIDFVVGLIPFVGDLADAYVKCNSKNVRLFEEHLDKMYRPEELKAKDKQLVKEHKPKPRPATIHEDFSDEEGRSPFDDPHGNLHQPGRAYSPSRPRVPDEEMGYPRQESGVTRQDPSRNVRRG